MIDKSTFDGITIGTVVDNNDPQQMGRVRALCPALGDHSSMAIKDIPWAMYGSPLAGIDKNNHRGREAETTSGGISYGMWNIPKVGAQVLIACIDGNPGLRVSLGCIYRQYHTNTIPHGRYFGTVNGPMSASEEPIQPLYDNLQENYGDMKSYEFRSRGADFSAAGLQSDFLGTPYNKSATKPDDKHVKVTGADGKTFEVTQGYGVSQLDPNGTNSVTGRQYDSTVYSWTSPGFHGISMDDRSENCRMKFRTTGGHQVILDDTNERIYISTAKGKTWIEIDEQGTIDIFSEQDFSVRSDGDINFTTNKTFRVAAKEGIHLACTEGQIRLHANQDIDIKSEQVLKIESVQDMKIQSHANIHIKAETDSFFTSGSVMNILTGSDLRLTSNGSTHLTASGQFVANGDQIHLNGAAGNPATNASPADAKEAFWTSRVPSHESWARTYMDMTADQDFGNSHTPEYGYDDPNVGTGSSSRGINFNRNTLWRR